MTADANSLTERVTKPAKGAGTTWSAPSNDFRVLVAALGQLGYDTDGLLTSVGLHESELNDPDARIPCELYGRLLSRAQQERFIANLSLELARRTPMGAYPLLDYLVLTSASVGAGVKQLARYFRLVGNPVVISVHEDGEPVRVELAGAAPFSIEYVVSLIVLHFRTETDGRFAVSNVSFRHAPDDATAFERALGCGVRRSAQWNGLSLPPESWYLPLRRRDPVLRQILEAQANDILARQPARTGLALETQRALTARMAAGDARIEGVARQLAISARTLQRRLAAEGLSYHELLDDARKEAAGRYMRESSLAIGEIAYLVGYSEPAPFHRAFKRWYGTTPDIFRRAAAKEATRCATRT